MRDDVDLAAILFPDYLHDLVSDLLRNVVAFCNSNPIMDEGSVKQLSSILETTMTALGAFHQNVAETQGSTQKISDSIAKLTGFLNSLTAAPAQDSEE